MKILGSSSLSYKFTSPADCQQLPAIEEMSILDPGSCEGGIGGIEDVRPNIKSLLDYFDPIKNNLLEILKNDNRYITQSKRFLFDTRAFSFREDETAPDELTNFFGRDDVSLFIPPQIFLQSDKPTNHMFRDPIVPKTVSFEAKKYQNNSHQLSFDTIL